MDWFGNGPDDGNRRQIQSLVVGQHNTSGAPVEISRDHRRLPGRGMHWSCLSRCSTSTFRSRHRSSTPPTPSRWPELRRFGWRPATRLPLSPPIATGSPMTRHEYAALVPGHIVLSCRQGHHGWVVSVYSQQCDTAELPVRQHRLPGRQRSPYTITLPAASSVAAGTGFTFSVLGSATVTIATTGSDTSTAARSHSGRTIATTSSRMRVSSWHEVFRTNAVNPRFSGASDAALLYGRHTAGIPRCGSHGVCQQWPQAKRRLLEQAPGSRSSTTVAAGSRYAVVCRLRREPRRSPMHKSAAA